jgi:tetratricopeptide (TPR) repeat protein
MAFSTTEIDNLLELLLHQDSNNIGIALAILDNNEPPIDNKLLYALNMLSLLSPYNVPYNDRKQKKVNNPKYLEMQAKIALHDEIEKVLAKYLKAAPQLGAAATFHQDIFIFALAADKPDKQTAWKRWLKKYKAVRQHYEPLFLQHSAWHNSYFALVRFFYQVSEYWLCIDFADALLSALPNNHNCGMYRYNAVYNLLHKGEAREELPKQIQFAQNALKTQREDTHCLYNVLIANNYFFYYKDNEQAEKYYREALRFQKNDEQFAKSKHAALAANNIATILRERGGDMKEAYKLILLANSLSPNSSNYLDSLGYHEWQTNNDAKKAKGIFERVLLLDAAHITTHAHLLRIFLAQQNFAKAKIHLNAILSSSMENMGGQFDQAHILAGLYAAQTYMTENDPQNVLLADIAEFIGQLG